MVKADFSDLFGKITLDNIKNEMAKAAKGKGKDGVIDANERARLEQSYLELKADETPKPARRLFKTNETSIQSMTKLQSENPRGLLVFRDELIGLLAKWDREDGADERAYFLEGWNGNGSYTDFKIGRGLTEAPQICISLLGGIQPDKLRRYLHQAQKGNNDGLMQRLQLAVWPDEPESWKLIDTTPNKAARERVFKILSTLAKMDFLENGANQGEFDKRPYYRFDDAAQRVFDVWLTELQTAKIKTEENPMMAEHLGKYRSLMPSLALIFHLIEVAHGKAIGAISEKSARLAVDWCAYLESHARRIYASAVKPEHESAIALSKKILANKLPNPFNAKDAYKNHWHGLSDRQEVESAANILVDEGWLAMAAMPPILTGRPPLQEYLINPKIFQETTKQPVSKVPKPTLDTLDTTYSVNYAENSTVADIVNEVEI